MMYHNSLITRMFHKFNYDTFVVTANFKDDYTLAITASDSLSGDFFINEAVELTKIKKDTIIATLSRRCEGQLKCNSSSTQASSTSSTSSPKNSSSPSSSPTTSSPPSPSSSPWSSSRSPRAATRSSTPS